MRGRVILLNIAVTLTTDPLRFGQLRRKIKRLRSPPICLARPTEIGSRKNHLIGSNQGPATISNCYSRQPLSRCPPKARVTRSNRVGCANLTLSYRAVSGSKVQDPDILFRASKQPATSFG